MAHQRFTVKIQLDNWENFGRPLDFQLSDSYCICILPSQRKP